MNGVASTGVAAALLPVLTPAGTEAAALHGLTVVLLVGGAVSFAGTLLLLALALRRKPRRAVPAAWWIVGGGVVLPLAVLTALLGYSTARTASLERVLADPPLLVTVTGRLWWWEVRYRSPAGGPDVVLANELRLPIGQATQIALLSADVIHSFWVPQLGGKRDLVPGRVNHLVVTPTQPGTFRGFCAEYCGEQHARMGLHVVALPLAEFERWLAAQARPAPAPAPDEPGELTRGRAAFVEHGCVQCHTVRGLTATPTRSSGPPGGAAAAAAPLGPDLTHVASRLSLGAGTLPNSAGAMKRWLVDVQRLKPGARMPPYEHLDAATQDALARWLEQLE